MRILTIDPGVHCAWCLGTMHKLLDYGHIDYASDFDVVNESKRIISGVGLLDALVIENQYFNKFTPTIFRVVEIAYMWTILGIQNRIPIVLKVVPSKWQTVLGMPKGKGRRKRDIIAVYVLNRAISIVKQYFNDRDITQDEGCSIIIWDWFKRKGILDASKARN